MYILATCSRHDFIPTCIWGPTIIALHYLVVNRLNKTAGLDISVLDNLVDRITPV